MYSNTKKKVCIFACLISVFRLARAEDDYERVTSLAYFAVLAFPLLIGACCIGSFIWGCVKDEYKSIHIYKEDENKGNDSLFCIRLLSRTRYQLTTPKSNRTLQSGVSYDSVGI
jgi:hypothetical protein